MAVRVRLPEMRQHSRGTRPAQGQRRRLLHPVYRAHGQPPPEPDTRRRKRARPPLRVLYTYPGGRGGRKMRFPKLYECDPQKNTECNKRNCGNPCKHTTRKEFAREPSGSELLGKVVVITQMKKIPTACAYCKYYENMGGNRGRGSDGACTARGTLYATRGIRVSKERLDNCPLRIITGGRE